MHPKKESNLSDVPETMLWTLHNRANEASRKDGAIKDEKSIEIYNAIDYDYESSFGKSDPSHALRSIIFDKEIRNFLKQHPRGTVVNLGEGLETQRFRIQGADAFWISVDLPVAIKIRERFIKPDQQHVHCSRSVLDRKWFDLVPANNPVFITAQGLLMYFLEDEVKQLLQDISNRFPGSSLMFDSIPVWLSNKTMGKGWQKTSTYKAPEMPWGINRHKMKSTIKSWVDIDRIDTSSYFSAGFPRGYGRWLYPLICSTPILGRYIPLITKIQFAPIRS